MFLDPDTLLIPKIKRETGLIMLMLEEELNNKVFHCSISTDMIKFLVMDVDGTLTDGKVYMGPDGEAMKVLNIKDGYSIKMLLHQKKSCSDYSPS